MKLRSALTLVELSLVIALVAILAAGAEVAYSSAKQRYALKLSSDNLVSELKRAHIFSREERDDKSWGIKVVDDTNYALVSRDAVNVINNFSFSLVSPIRFSTGPVEVWFDQATGNTESDITIGLLSSQGRTRVINVTVNGVITGQ